MSANDALAGLVASQSLSLRSFLGLRDCLPDRMWVGHVDDGEFRLVARGVNLDGPYPEDAIDEPLRDIYGADVLERHCGPVLAQDAPHIQEFAVGDGERSGARLDVPIQQDDDADAKGDDQQGGKLIQEFAVAGAQDEDANTKGGDQQDVKNELEGMRPEHRRMRLVNHRSPRHRLSLSLFWPRRP